MFSCINATARPGPGRLRDQADKHTVIAGTGNGTSMVMRFVRQDIFDCALHDFMGMKGTVKVRN